MRDGHTTGAESARSAGETGDPISRLKQLVDQALAPLLPVLSAIEHSHWNVAVRPEVVLRAVTFMALLDPAVGPLIVRSGSEGMVRWFLGMRSYEPAMDSETLGLGQQRLITNVLARRFIKEVIAATRVGAGAHPPTSFHENVALIEAWTGETKVGARRELEGSA